MLKEHELVMPWLSAFCHILPSVRHVEGVRFLLLRLLDSMSGAQM